MLPDDAAELRCTFELRGTLRLMIEETLVRLIEAFEDFLDSLTVQTGASDALREMSLHLRTRTVTSRQGIVPLLQSECVIPHETGLAQHRVELEGCASKSTACIRMSAYSKILKIIEI